MSNFSDVPNSYTEARESAKWNCWERAIADELAALRDNETWVLVNQPNNAEIISNRWVFRVKENTEGDVLYKARLVVKGFEQNIISQIHAPVARLSTLRVILSICNTYDLYLEQLDVKNTFLNGLPNEKVFMEIPEGLQVSDSDKNKVCLWA